MKFLFTNCFSSTGELERIISEAQGIVYYGVNTLNQLVGSFKCPTLSKNGENFNSMLE